MCKLLLDINRLDSFFSVNLHIVAVKIVLLSTAKCKEMNKGPNTKIYDFDRARVQLRAI